MSRTLNDDFDEDDLPAGARSLDLETGSQVGGGAAASSYDQGGIDFDDELTGDDTPRGALELDLPNAPPAMPRPAAPPAPPAPSMDGVPDLAFRAPAAPASRPNAQQQQQPQAPPPRSSGSLPAVRTTGTHPAAAPPPSSSGAGLNAPGPAADESDPAMSERVAPPPPSRPDAASVIAKYPAPPQQISGAPMYAIRVLLRQLELRSDLESLRRRRSPDVKLYEAALGAYDRKTFRLGMAINGAALTIGLFIFFLPVIIRFMRAD